MPRIQISYLSFWAGLFCLGWGVALPAQSQTIDAFDSNESVASSADLRQLGADSFRQRTRAAERLLGRGDEAIPLLIEGLADHDLEIREASLRILRRLHNDLLDRERDRLLQRAAVESPTLLPIWNWFRQSAGDDVAARRLYCDLVDRYRECCVALSGDAALGYRVPHPRHLDPDRVDARDLTQWLMLFAVDSNRPSITLTSRLSDTLKRSKHSPLRCVPVYSRDPAEQVLQRVIGHWLSRPRVGVTDLHRLEIALRYGCDAQVKCSSHQILSQPLAEPRSVAVALLALATTDDPDLDAYLTQYRRDERVVAYRAQRNPKCAESALMRTRITDVVLAIEFHRRGIDPRIVGFYGLEADPAMIYRYDSLGFVHEQDRQQAWRRLAEHLSVR